jgi:hypothetical protein
VLCTKISAEMIRVEKLFRPDFLSGQEIIRKGHIPADCCKK